MAPICSHNKANSISSGLFLIALGILFYTNYWWPGILLALAVTFGARDFLRGRIYDFAITIVIFLGLFLFFFFNASWSFAVPVLFTLAGIALIVREIFFRKERSLIDETEDISHTISEESHERERKR